MKIWEGMNKPFKYFILDDQTGKVVGRTNTPPLLYELQTWEKAGIDSHKLVQTRTAYIDTRYEARLRLWEYITFTKKGLPIPRYNPYAGSEIGKTLPILQ